ncbi:hypothetical protein D3C80_1626150 [compost metagenome]
MADGSVTRHQLGPHHADFLTHAVVEHLLQPVVFKHRSAFIQPQQEVTAGLSGGLVAHFHGRHAGREAQATNSLGAQLGDAIEPAVHCRTGIRRRK